MRFSILDTSPATAEKFGGPAWQQERLALLQTVAEGLNAKPEFSASSAKPPSLASEQRLLCGLTTVADWIASGETFDEPSTDWHSHIASAVDGAGFTAFAPKANLSFEDIFGFPPLPAQEQFYQNVRQGAVHVLEAPMGMGKTEAALYGAYRLLEAGQAAGLYFALPTQLTSNRIHQRVAEFLKRIKPEKSAENEQAPGEVLLLHGKSWIHTVSTLGEDAAPGGAWFHTSKRGILAPFGVGTIDQALLAIMNVKYGSVRAFGLGVHALCRTNIHWFRCGNLSRRT